VSTDTKAEPTAIRAYKLAQRLGVSSTTLTKWAKTKPDLAAWRLSQVYFSVPKLVAAGFL
jgi:DNA-binding transcriptional regulator YdaS (Cro superfamily)